MKQLTVFLLLLSLLLTACASREPKHQEPVLFFYCRDEIAYGSSDSVICSEPREAVGHKDDTAYLLTQYLLGPTSPDLRSPLPAGTALISYRQESTQAILVLSDHIAALSGVELTVACACIAKTVLELSGAATVEIRANSMDIGESGVIIMSRDNLLILDDAAIEPAQ